jgi:hypothetical protein
MLNSSVFIFFMFRALYRMICKSSKKNFGKKILNVPNVKLLSKFFFNNFGFFKPFWWEWQLALYILSDFPGIKNLSGLNDLNSFNNLSGLNDLYSLISSKHLYSKVKSYWTIYCALLVWFTYHHVKGAQHKKNKNWWISHKWAYLMNR